LLGKSGSPPLPPQDGGAAALDSKQKEGAAPSSSFHLHACTWGLFSNWVNLFIKSYMQFIIFFKLIKINAQFRCTFFFYF
jgi:hypothetical protein